MNLGQARVRQPVINAAESRLWNAMDKATVDLARKLANDDNRAI